MAVAMLRDYLIALNKVFKELAHCLTVSKVRQDSGSVLGSLGLGRRIQASKKWFRGSTSGEEKEEKMSGWRRSRPTSFILSSASDRIITSSSFANPASSGIEQTAAAVVIPEESATGAAATAGEVQGGELLVVTPLPFGLDMGMTTQSLCTVLGEAYETIARLVETADRGTVFSSSSNSSPSATTSNRDKVKPKIKTKGLITQDLYELVVSLESFVQRDVMSSVLGIIERERLRSELGRRTVPYAVAPSPGMATGIGSAQNKRQSFINIGNGSGGIGGIGGTGGGGKEGEQGRLERLLGQLINEQGAS